MPEVPQASNAPNQRKSRKSPRDFTGMTKERDEAQHEVEVDEASKQMALATAERAQEKNQVVDYSSLVTPVLDEVESAKEVEVADEICEIRVNSDIDQMTYGRQVIRQPFTDENGVTHDAVLGSLNFLDFEAGVKYKVPRHLKDHLARLGYLYDY